MILDAKNAILSAAEGVELCTQTVIPALFPFFLLSASLVSALRSKSLPFLRPLCKFCGLPTGSEGILLSGLLGGYPVGAQCVCQEYQNGNLSASDARRMLGFCSNAGPAFLFGITGIIFNQPSISFILWLIHIFSALLTGAILPGGAQFNTRTLQQSSPKSSAPLLSAMKSTAIVCGWVVIFRMLIGFTERWFLWLLPSDISIFIKGILELTNGYIELSHIQNQQLRFIYASIFLSWGGICVGLQTLTITSQADLGPGYYFPGKLLQTAISLMLSTLLSFHLFNTGTTIPFFLAPILLFAGMGTLFLLKKQKICSSFLKPSDV